MSTMAKETDLILIKMIKTASDSYKTLKKE
jgi:hypothetical protein